MSNLTITIVATLPAKQTYQRLRPDVGQEYFYIDSTTEIRLARWVESKDDTMRWHGRNVYMHHDDAKRECRRRWAQARLRDVADELHGGPLSNDFAYSGPLFGIIANPYERIVTAVDFPESYRMEGAVLFKSKGMAEEAMRRMQPDSLCDLFGMDRAEEYLMRASQRSIIKCILSPHRHPSIARTTSELEAAMRMIGRF